MTVRAVDMQIVVQKSAEIAQSRYPRDAKTRLQLQQQAQVLQQRTQIENRQIKYTQKAEHAIIRDDEGKKDSKGYKKRDQKKEKRKKATKNIQSGRIDIKI